MEVYPVKHVWMVQSCTVSVNQSYNTVYVCLRVPLAAITEANLERGLLHEAKWAEFGRKRGPLYSATQEKRAEVGSLKTDTHFRESSSGSIEYELR